MVTTKELNSVLAPDSNISQKSESANSPIGDFIQETLAQTKRLFIQLQRRPSTLIAGVIQPFMWLILFGALFSKAPQGLFGDDLNYATFLAPGVIVFTAFSGGVKCGIACNV